MSQKGFAGISILILVLTFGAFAAVFYLGKVGTQKGIINQQIPKNRLTKLPKIG